MSFRISDRTVSSPSQNNPGELKPRWKVGTLVYTSAGLIALFTWLLLGDFCYQLRERSATPVALIMLKKFHASDLVTGIFMLTIPWAMILLAGPVVSYWSDHHRGRWGRRIPFLLLPTPIVTLAMLGLAYSPRIGPVLNLWLGGDVASVERCILLTMGACWTTFEIGVVLSNAVFNGLINDVVPRIWLGRFFGLSRAVSLGAGVLFNYKVLGLAEEYFTYILATIGIIYGVGMSVMCFRVKEGSYPPSLQASDRSSTALATVGTYFRQCFSHTYYLWVFIFIGLANSVFMPVNTFALYAAKSYGMTMGTLGKYYTAMFVASFLLAFPFGWLADRLHPLRVALAVLCIYIVITLAGFFWIHDAKSFGMLFFVHGVISGSFMTGTAAIGQFLFPRLKFAQFAAAANCMAAIFNILLGPAVGTILDDLKGEYRYIFIADFLLACVCLAVGLVVYRIWQRLGGQSDYITP